MTNNMTKHSPRQMGAQFQRKFPMSNAWWRGTVMLLIVFAVFVPLFIREVRHPGFYAVLALSDKPATLESIGWSIAVLCMVWAGLRFLYPTKTDMESDITHKHFRCLSINVIRTMVAFLNFPMTVGAIDIAPYISINNHGYVWLTSSSDVYVRADVVVFALLLMPVATLVSTHCLTFKLVGACDCMTDKQKRIWHDDRNIFSTDADGIFSKERFDRVSSRRR